MKHLSWRHIKGSFRSWTALFGYALILLPVVQTEWHVWGNVLPEAVRPYALSIIGMAVVVLRFKTTQSLADKVTQGE